MKHTRVTIIIFALLFLAGSAAADPGISSLAKTPEPLAPETGRLLTLPAIKVDRLTLDNNDLLTVEELQQIGGPYLGRNITFEELEELRQKLTRAIVAKGYVNSGVIIPDQEIRNGEVRLVIIRGTLSAVQLTGNRHFATGYLKGKLERGGVAPLNINQLQENLQLLQLDPRIRSIQAELKPGEKPGESVLKARIEENRPFSLLLEAGNGEPPGTGSYRGDATLSYTNLLGTGDVIEGRFGLTEGNQDYSGRIAVPVNSYDTTLELFGRKGDSTVIDEHFQDLNIKSRSDSVGLRLLQPVPLSLSTQLKFSLTGEYRQSVSTLDGTPFSLTAGADDGRSRLAVMRFSQEYVNRSQQHVLALNSTMNFGIDAFRSTVHDSGDPEIHFFSWLAQLITIWQSGQHQLVGRLNAQLTDDRLLPMEKFSVGGINSVRGYRQGLFVRDSGVSGTIEARILLASDRSGQPLLYFIPFFDCGQSWNVGKGSAGESDFIDSIGAGFKWTPFKDANIEIYYGKALRNAPQHNHDPQDYGVHFNTSWQVF